MKTKYYKAENIIIEDKSGKNLGFVVINDKPIKCKRISYIQRLWIMLRGNR